MFDEGCSSNPLDVVVVDGVEEGVSVLLGATLKGGHEIGVEVGLDLESSSSCCVLLEEEGEAWSLWIPDEGAKFSHIICKPSNSRSRVTDDPSKSLGVVEVSLGLMVDRKELW